MIRKKSVIAILLATLVLMFIAGCSEVLTPGLPSENEKKPSEQGLAHMQAPDHQQATEHLPDQAQAELPFGPSCYEVTFTEDFSGLENYQIPLGWDDADSGDGQWGASPYSIWGHYGIRFRCDIGFIGTSRIITRCIDGTGKENLKLSLYIAVYDTSPGAGDYEIKVEASTDKENWVNVWGIPSASIPTNPSQSQYTLENLDLSNYDGQIFYLSFVFWGDSTKLSELHIDDISVVGDDVTI